MKPLCLRFVGCLSAMLAFSGVSLDAQDIYLTTGGTGCPACCPYDIGGKNQSPYLSGAYTDGRTYSLYSTADTAVWPLKPTLASSNGTYRIFVTKGRADECSTNLIVNMTAIGGTLTDTNGVPHTVVPTTAFQASNSVDCWTLVSYIDVSTNKPEVTFTYASGTISGTSRWYMDAVYFQSVRSITNPATSARITEILYGNPVVISGTGAVAHPFVLVSSPDAARAPGEWTRESTNSDGSGSFSFEFIRDTARRRFFRVITQ